MSKFENVNPFGKTKDYPIWKKRSSNEEGKQDPMLYVIDSKMLENIGKLPFSNAVGNEISVARRILKTAGIYVLEYLPTLGYNSVRSQALNKAADSQFNYLTQGYSTNVSFEAPDIEFFKIACYEAVSVLALIKRAYGCLRKYSNYNRYYAKLLLNAMGMNYEDFCKRQAEIRNRYNVLADRINKTLKIPKDSKYLARRLDINGQVFADGLGCKYQTYLYVPRFSYMYDGYTLPTGTSLRITPLPNYAGPNTGKVDTWFQVVEDLLSQLQGDTDVNNMSGAILRVYGESGCLKIGSLDENFEVPVIYDEVWLQQIHNAMIMPATQGSCAFGFKTNDDSFVNIWNLGTHEQNCVVYQTADGTIMSRPTLQAADKWGNSLKSSILDVLPEVPDPGIVMDATRLKYTVGTPLNSMWPVYCGSEVIISADIYYDPDDYSQRSIYQMRSTDNYDLFTELSSQFEMAPFIFKVHGSATDADFTIAKSIIGDLHNFTIIEGTYLRYMNEQVFYGLLDVPANVKSIT